MSRRAGHWRHWGLLDSRSEKSEIRVFVALDGSLGVDFEYSVEWLERWSVWKCRKTARLPRPRVDLNDGEPQESSFNIEGESHSLVVVPVRIILRRS